MPASRVASHWRLERRLRRRAGAASMWAGHSPSATARQPGNAPRLRRRRGAVAHELFLPPLRPAAAFWARFPPLPLPLLRRLWPLPPPLPERLPPLLDASGVLAIAAARPLLMPFLRRPSYCLSFFTDGP